MKSKKNAKQAKKTAYSATVLVHGRDAARERMNSSSSTPPASATRTGRDIPVRAGSCTDSSATTGAVTSAGK